MKSEWSINGPIGCVVATARQLFLTILMLTLAASVFAKMYEEPKSFSLKDKSQDQVDRRVLPTINIERLLEEDRANGKNPQARVRSASLSQQMSPSR